MGDAGGAAARRPGQQPRRGVGGGPAAAAAPEVEVRVRHATREGEAVVVVPGSATFLEVKLALLHKVGRGQPRRVRLARRVGNTFSEFEDWRRLGAVRELHVLGLNLPAAGAAGASSEAAAVPAAEGAAPAPGAPRPTAAASGGGAGGPGLSAAAAAAAAAAAEVAGLAEVAAAWPARLPGEEKREEAGPAAATTPPAPAPARPPALAAAAAHGAHDARSVARLVGALRAAYAAPELQAKLRAAARRFEGSSMGYFEQVRDLTAEVQKPIFAEFGLPAPPGGVAALRRLTMKYEKERDTEVLELCLQCRLLLGVEGGIAITDTLDVPFFRQSEPDNCVQANMKMALKWCFPDREYSFERLDELTGRRPGSWTWPSQAVAALAKERVDVRLFSSGPWEEILAGGEAFLRGHFEPGTAEIVLSKTDLPALMQSLEALRDSEILQRRTLSGGEVREAFLRDELVLLPIDYARISPFPGVNAESRAYSGHMVLVTGWGQHHVRIHDSLGIADKIVQTFQLFDAWGAPGADNDVILIRGATAAQE